ncbi:lipid A biosynthesis acyltransferase [Wenyingzhuangia fucanilytica]|uniref:Lipid A biosynthesis acyltransferase n=1 Tax=Wenyingzhuangia fucanilytica TaxID=1790137 RepID=A0A1B1Y6L6_9FLAO|nr:lipid A biosynthesis acyltransferase [Wenyingzhuangia fucanilytica]ANW96422.1 lipid A biosynthesis acyltransferase [Wenyingzhuangia fucanilytica]
MNKERIIFTILYPIIYIISKLPLSILYGISNLLYYLVYYIIGYRKKTVRKNLALCFPEKTDKERLEIEKKSFRHFVDIFIEMLKGFGINEKELNKRYIYKNPELIEEYGKENQSILIVGAHHGNWEWLFNINRRTSLKCIGVYNKVENKYFDKYVKENRARFGSYFVTTKETIPTIIDHYRKKIPSLYVLLSDQSPQVGKTHYWAPFFGHVVPIHTGAEMLANRFNHPVIYMDIKMPKRGHYEVTFEKLTAAENSTSEYPLTDAYLEKIEAAIRKNPETYFWTHNRFKHLGKAPKK